MQTMSATYAPDDNKIRIYAAMRLDADTYARVRAAGFVWAPKQDLFVAPAWSPEREDLAIDLCGTIEDEDRTLVERADDRAERFEGYAEARTEDATRAREAVAAIADAIPLGQPILVGHHSERHARKDADRITAGMARTVRLWDQAQYWQRRAEGAIRHAKYKERPDVRARRIKGLEADLRKVQKNLRQAEQAIRLWQSVGDPSKWKAKDGSDRQPTPWECARAIANYDHLSMYFPLAEYPRALPASQYEGPMGLWSALEGIVTADQAQALAIAAHTRTLEPMRRWIAHLTNRLTYERAMQAESGGTAADKVGPEKGGACRCWASPRGGWSYIRKVNKVSVTVEDNWGNGGRTFTRTIPFDKLTAVLSAAEVQAARDAGRLVECDDKTGFYLAPAPTPDPEPMPTPEPTAAESDPPAETAPEAVPAEDTVCPDGPTCPDPGCRAARRDLAQDVDALRATLRAGVQVVAAPSLFPTPPVLASQMVELAHVGSLHRVLEPSAGTGNLIAAICHDTHAGLIVAVEINPTLADGLRRRWDDGTVEVRTADFLECNGDLGRFDRIVMNPPFDRGADVRHIQHAIGFLRPGGRLVALCANGPRQRAALQPIADTWIDLPAGTFHEAGTEVRVALLTITARG